MTPSSERAHLGSASVVRLQRGLLALDFHPERPERDCVPLAAVTNARGVSVPDFDPERLFIEGTFHTTLPATPSREVNHDSHMLGSEFVAALQRVTPRSAYISGLDARKAAVGSAVASLPCRNAGYHSNWLYLASAIPVRSEVMA